MVLFLLHFKTIKTYCFSWLAYTTLTQKTDINECLEQIDNCNPNTQLCLNNNGGFECQDRVHKGCASGFQFDDVLKECQGFVSECFTKYAIF